MSVTGGRLGGGGRPRTCSTPASMVTSDISTNSRSRIFFVTLVEREAAGLKGPARAAGREVAGRGEALSMMGFLDSKHNLFDFKHAPSLLSCELPACLS